MADGGIHILIRHHAKHHADIAEECSDDNTLDDDQPQYAPWLSADGLANTKLMGALLDGDEHDVRDTYDTTQQGEQTHYPESSANDGNALLHLQTLRIAVPQPDSTLVLRMYLMVGIDTTAIVGLEVFVRFLRFQSMESKLDIAGIVSISPENALDGGIGRESLCLTILGILIDANHLEHEIIDLDITSHQRLIVFGRQFFCLVTAQHEHLALLLQVDIIDESAIEHIHLVNLDMVGVNTQNAGTDILLIVADGNTDAIAGTHLVNMVHEIASRCINITRLQTDCPTLLQTVVWF